MMRRNTITYKGVTSSSLDVYTSSGGEYDVPKRDFTEQSVVGRNGVLLIDNGRYENVDVAYNLLLFSDAAHFAEKMIAVDAWLNNVTGYERLTDTYAPLYYRMAVPKGGLKWKIQNRNTVATTTLTFNCKPQRYLISGETAVTISTSGNTITNPTAFTALPMMRVYGTGDGTLSIGTCELELGDIDGYVDIDCDVRHAFKGTANMNSKVTAANEAYMNIPSGAQAVNFTGDITSVSIIGRWWTL